MTMQQTYQNPVIPGFNPDPSICRKGQDYYLVTSSFEYYPGVPIYHSRDLVNWSCIGHCLTRASQLPLAEDDRYSRGIWAPTIRYHAGRFYMTTTNMSYGRRNFYVYSDDPAGEWSDPVWVDQEGIDPSFFFDEDGKVYYITSANLLSEIDLQTGKLLGQSRNIWEGTGLRNPEGPHLYKKDGWYYLMEAEGGLEGHVETIARSRSVWGPYEECPHNPILSHVTVPQSPIQGTGHGDLCQAHDGSWWIVFLGTRPNGVYVHADHLGRETFLAPVEWDADGWPIVNGNGQVTLEMASTTIDWSPRELPASRDDFDTAQLATYWNFIRNPVEDDYSLSERVGALRLTGAARNLSEAGQVTFVGRRQEQMVGRFCASLDFDPLVDGEEAGLTVLMCFAYHYDVAITRINGMRRLIVRRTVGSLSSIVAEVEMPRSPIVLEVRTEASHYALGYQNADGAFAVLAKGETRFLSATLAETFTGVYLGMYATGNGRRSTSAAYIDWCEYTTESQTQKAEPFNYSGSNRSVIQ